MWISTGNKLGWLLIDSPSYTYMYARKQTTLYIVSISLTLRQRCKIAHTIIPISRGTYRPSKCDLSSIQIEPFKIRYPFKESNSSTLLLSHFNSGQVLTEAKSLRSKYLNSRAYILKRLSDPWKKTGGHNFFLCIQAETI